MPIVYLKISNNWEYQFFFICLEYGTFELNLSHMLLKWNKGTKKENDNVEIFPQLLEIKWITH